MTEMSWAKFAIEKLKSGEIVQMVVLQKIFWPQLVVAKHVMPRQYLVYLEIFCNTTLYRGRTFGDLMRVVFVEETGGRKIDEIHMSEG